MVCGLRGLCGSRGLWGLEAFEGLGVWGLLRAGTDLSPRLKRVWFVPKKGLGLRGPEVPKNCPKP